MGHLNAGWGSAPKSFAASEKIHKFSQIFTEKILSKFSKWNKKFCLSLLKNIKISRKSFIIRGFKGAAEACEFLTFFSYSSSCLLIFFLKWRCLTSTVTDWKIHAIPFLGALIFELNSGGSHCVLLSCTLLVCEQREPSYFISAYYTYLLCVENG